MTGDHAESSKLRRGFVRGTAVASALAGFLAAASAWGQSPDPAILVPLSASIVRVEARGEPGGLLLGTGVTVAPSIVVTNCHVIRNATSVHIAGFGRRFEVAAEYADSAHDLCFLHVPSWAGRPVALAQSDALRVGQPVVAIGFTGGAGVMVRFGRVRALHAIDDARIVESTAAFASGASGGGLFGTDGTLVGVLTFRLRTASGNYYALPVRWISERLPTEAQWVEVRPLRDATPFWQQTEDALPFFMRSASLDAQGQWRDLLELADRWSSVRPQETEPILVRGKALQQLNRPAAALEAFNDALRLSPDDPLAWYGLALAHAAIGDDAALGRAKAKLEELDDGLGAELVVDVDRLRKSSRLSGAR